MTLKMIKEHRNVNAKDEERLFISEDGMPLVWVALVHGKLKKSDSIRGLFWRLQMKTGINDGRCFYCLRRTGATMIEQIDPAATEMYLAHSD